MVIPMTVNKIRHATSRPLGANISRRKVFEVSRGSSDLFRPGRESKCSMHRDNQLSTDNGSRPFAMAEAETSWFCYHWQIEIGYI